MKQIAFLFFFSCAVIVAFSQNKVNGKVTDAKDGSPIVAASIKIVGLNSGTTSNADGTFQISLTAGQSILVSEVGHVTATVFYDGNGFINVALSPKTDNLDILVITGVGSATSKKKTSIDVATLNLKETGKSAVASLEQALQGRIAGANIQFTSGLPGTAAQIYLRGINDLSGSGPLILVDGVEIRGGLQGLDMSAVERVEVVKGAAGGTLYGAQGANGVIQIFTKKGLRGGRPIISFQRQMTFDQILSGKNLLANNHCYVTDSEGYILDGFGNRIAPDVNNAWADPVFEIGNDVLNNKPYKEKLYDHIDQAYRRAMTSNTNLNISGGSEKSDYAFSMGYLNQQNVLFNGYKRINLGSNLGFNLAKGLNIRSNSQLIYTNEDLLAGGSRFNLTNSWRYIDFTAKDSKGYTVVKPKLNENQLNPLSEKEWRTRGSKEVRVLHNFNINYKFPKFLELDYKYGIEYTNNDINDLIKNQRQAPQSGAGYWGTNVDGVISKGLNNTVYQNSLASAFVKFDFSKDFNLKLPINATTRFSYDWRNLQNRQYTASGSILPNYPPYNINVATIKTSGDYSDQFITYGLLFNQSFDYSTYGGISIGFRSDYSSEFGEAKKPQQFFRVTGYFRPTETELIKTNHLTEWKLRAAFGQAGIQPYSFLPYARQLVLDVSTIGTGGVGLASPSQSRNPLLQLSKSNELELGTDFTINTGWNTWLKNINISTSYWQRKVYDSYQFGDRSPSTGFSQAIDNLTDLSSKGFDFSLDADVYQSRCLSWNSGIRLAQFKTKADKIANGADVVTGIFALKQGQNLGVFYTQTPLSSVDQLNSDGERYIPVTDISNYEIVNGMVVDKTTKKVMITDPNDQKIMGSAYPKFNASFINNFTICKNFNIAMQWDWRYGNKIYNLTRQWLYRDRLSADYDEAVTINGQSGAYVNYYNSLYNSVSPISWFVESGSMMRLRDLSLTYNIENKYKPIWVNNASITLAGRNLFTITNYKGLDPEATNTSDAQGNEATGVGAINGVDYFGVPNLKSFIITLNLGF